MNNILEVKALEKSFKNVKAVNGISFALEPGDIFAFLGPNGAGKTTTLRILLDIIKADNGSISWGFNGSTSSLPNPAHIGYLPEERGLYLDLPVLRTLVYMASIRGMHPADAKKAAMEWLERLDLGNRATEKLQTLSKGNQQKIQFIASILHKPSFAILDEPFSGLDPLNQEKFIEYIQELNQQGCTILLSSHQMPLVEKIAKKIFMIHQGQEIFYGKLADIYKNRGAQHTLDITFLGKAPLEKLQQIEELQNIQQEDEHRIKIIFRQGANLNMIMGQLSTIEGIANLKSQNATLHDIFLEMLNNKVQ